MPALRGLRCSVMRGSSIRRVGWGATMGARVLRAKLLAVRALSTVVLILALARSAAAQFGGPRYYEPDGWYLGGAQASVRAASISDRATDATWVMDKANLLTGSLEYGRSDRSMGARVVYGTIPMSFEGASCLACRGEVQMLTALAVYRRGGPLFNTGLSQIIELAVGATQWSNLSGVSGPQLPTMSPQTDFTYAVSIGAGLPIGQRLEVMAAYDVQQIKHRPRSGTNLPSSSGSVGLAVVRIGARWRLAAP